MSVELKDRLAGALERLSENLAAVKHRGITPDEVDLSWMEVMDLEAAAHVLNKMNELVKP